MYQAENQIKIGYLVKVDLGRIQDQIPNNLLEALSKDPTGRVLDYKMTDGRGIGYVLELNNGSTHWFFESEITSTQNLEQRPQNYKDNLPISEFRNKKNITRFSEDVMVLKEDIIDLINPIVFFKWLVYSLKDVF